MNASQRIRRASSVVLRRGGGDPRVYLVRRNPELRFFGGFWAFPGGGVSRHDAASSSLIRGAEDETAAFIVSAARELYEELGLFAVTNAAGALVAPPEAEHRRRLLEDETVFARRLDERGLGISPERFLPIARLLTPAFSPIRFDTLFSRLDLDGWPEPHEPEIWPGELVDGRWDEPALWLKQWKRGEILIAPPVVLMLRILEQHGWEGALDALDQLTTDFATGKIHPIFNNPGVQLLPLRTPTLPPATHTNAYLIGRDPAYLVDPASPHPDVQARLDESLADAATEGRIPRAILLTHHHPDHVGGVEHARRRWALPVWAHAVTADLLHGQITVDRLLEAGERIPLGTAPDGTADWELEVHFTPGHAAGHVCFFERLYGSLVLGDMVSTLSSILVHPDDGDMAQYLESLERLAALPSRMVFPAHGPADASGPAVLRRQLEHRRAREQSIHASIHNGATAIDRVVEEVYGDVPPAMHGFAALSVQSVLVKLRREGRIRGEDGALRTV